MLWPGVQHYRCRAYVLSANWREESRFRMEPQFAPANTAELWRLSNAPILSLAPVSASLSIFPEAGMANHGDKSVRLTDCLEYLLEAKFGDRTASMTPADARGCPMSLQARDPQLDARAGYERLQSMNLITDWREPDVMRVAPAPLYNSYAGVHEPAERLSQAVKG